MVRLSLWWTLAVSIVLNCVLLFDRRRPASPEDARRLEEHSVTMVSNSMLQDCASAACPAHFHPSPPITTGHSMYRPWLADTRFRPRVPASMLELTQALYGERATLGEPYRHFRNVYGRQPNLKYEWTQINEQVLEKTWARLGGRIRFFVEVGSFVGRSSVMIADWLRMKERALSRPLRRPVPLLCIDTWLGDVGMALGKIYRDRMGFHNGHATLYHEWLLNIIHTNNTERVLSYLRYAADVIYLDSAHEIGETFHELVAYWPLLRPGGMLLGDDFNWMAVSHDVQLFVRAYNVTLASFDGCHEKLRAIPLSNKVETTCIWHIQKSAHERLRGAMQRPPGVGGNIG
jgi:hypothetical protein